jgi:hypothetical protein
MKRTLIILILALFTFTYGKSQDQNPSNPTDSIVYGYYYCFAMFGSDPVFFTQVFSEPQGEVALKPIIEQSWQGYVFRVLKRPGDVVIAVGPFQSNNYAWQDRQAWLSTIPDSVSKTEVQFIYSSNQ